MIKRFAGSRAGAALLSLAILVLVAEVSRRMIAYGMPYVPLDVNSWLIAGIGIGSLITSQMWMPRRRDRGKALGRVIRRWRYQRAVRAMEIRDDFGRPVAS